VEKQSAHSDFVTSVAFSPDGSTIVSGSNDQTIKVWDAGVSALTPSNPYHPLKARAPLAPHRHSAAR
jgi:WD40 repeat protein